MFYYQPGDTFTSDSDIVTSGLLTSSKKNIWFSITLPKSLKYVNNITMTKFVSGIRIVGGGYINSDRYDYTNDNTYTFSFHKNDSNCVSVIITKTSENNGTNNTPLALLINQITLTFS